MKNAVWNDDELSKIRNVDRLLPSQPHLQKLFTGNEDNFFASLENVLLCIQNNRSVEQKWDLELKPGVTYASLGADIGTLYFYQLIIAISGAKSVLELGTYIGVSTLFWAEALGPEGKVTTVEIGEEFYNIAERNIQVNDMAQRVEQILDSALLAMDKFIDEKRKFDCIFIDAAKESYDLLFTKALECISPKGLILVDDIFFQGETLNEEASSEKGLGVRKVLLKAESLNCFKSILPIGNGLLLIQPPVD
ncbi:MAG: hypothetical protein CMM37_07945 [Rhodospirillaceae bacterium]|nr:hypothetical protein [Rhodospirillaceae bacterium]|tara:strand:- start:32 stop:781 length:750 start_codon:yes stop_codon:yes gene_type:complete